MRFLDILERQGKDFTDVKKILETEHKKLNIVLSEVFTGKYVSKEVAIINLQELLESGNSKAGSVYISDNYDKIVEKIQDLNEANIKIIINNCEDSKEDSVMDESKKRVGRPKKGYLIDPAVVSKEVPELKECNTKKDKKDKLAESSIVTDDETDEIINLEDDKIDNDLEDDNDLESKDNSKLKWLDIIDKIKNLEDDIKDLMSDEDEEKEEEEDQEEQNEEDSELEDMEREKFEAAEDDTEKEITESDKDTEEEDENGTTNKHDSDEENTEEQSGDDAVAGSDDNSPVDDNDEDANEEMPDEFEPEPTEPETTDDVPTEEPEAEPSEENNEFGDIENDANELEKYMDEKFEKQSEGWNVENNISVVRNEDNTYSILNGEEVVATDEPKEIIRKVLQQEF